PLQADTPVGSANDPGIGMGSDPMGQCLQQGGLWDGRHCAGPGSERFCELIGGRWANGKCTEASSCRVCPEFAGSLEAFVVRTNNRTVVLLAKPGVVNRNIKPEVKNGVPSKG